MKNKIVTVFGGNGFMGRSVVQRLAQQGARVRVAVRNTDTANALRVYGDVGQVMPIQVSLRDQKAIEAVCKGAHSVINLTGRLYEKGSSTFQAVHVDGAKAIAKACTKQGVKRLIHISALVGDGKATSHYARSKQAGEKAVTKAFPDATLIRPSLVFGPNDSFFNRFASLAKISPVLTLFQGGRTTFQPLYVGDVAQAIINAMQASKTKGKTYELGGEKTYTFKDLMLIIMSHTGCKKMLVPLPNFVGQIMAFFLQFMPTPLITPDQLKGLKSNSVVGKKAKGLKDLGVTTPHALEAILPTYLSCYKPCF